LRHTVCAFVRIHSSVLACNYCQKQENETGIYRLISVYSCEVRPSNVCAKYTITYYSHKYVLQNEIRVV